MDQWTELYNEARRVQKAWEVSPFIEAGGVAAALMTKKGTIYVGACIDTASSLGMCAERNAIANMLTNEESQIEKIVAVLSDGSVVAPCGVCRESMMQLAKDSGEIEVLLDYEERKVSKLKELLPNWWGSSRFS
ncbi:cytidine deaminase family protein [Enterococcus asini]|uniref:Cytidine deaminase n=1 Tax=Enterococcus asini TaxID=57732 RepID=A0AAW8U0Q5_9ENTE|nr:cytidine deaminase [Enterococcus asini]MDT2809500.1 cytidine deaminase [Enterococcus asini]